MSVRLLPSEPPAPVHPLPPIPEAGPDPAYVVLRTRYVSPGTPYVVAASLDPAMADSWAGARMETYGATEMRAEPELARALHEWLLGDDRLFRRERELGDRAAALRPPRGRWHPCLGLPKTSSS